MRTLVAVIVLVGGVFALNSTADAARKAKRITIINAQQMPLADAMMILREALRQNGIVIEESPRVINMKSIAEARQSNLPVVSDVKYALGRLAAKFD